MSFIKILKDTELGKIGTIQLAKKFNTLAKSYNKLVDNQGNPLSSGGGSVVSRVITSEEILKLHSTPVELIPAPGEGNVILLERVIISLRFVSAYLGTNLLLQFKFKNVTIFTLDAIVLDDTASNIYTQEPNATSYLTSFANNDSLSVSLLANAIRGKSTLFLKLYYEIIEA